VSKVLRYLARYTHRVAISNRRLIAADETGREFVAWPEQVSFFLEPGRASRTRRMPLGRSQDIHRADPGGRVTPRF
jgi:hypothetical protein